MVPDGVPIVWQNLTIKANTKKSYIFKRAECSYKTIIDNVSGSVKAGSLVAILGSSGSGKTSLMSVLSSRNPGNLTVEGNITIAGHKIGPYMKHISGYVFQEDLFCPSLTVAEHLRFVAKLKFGKRMDENWINETISNILISLGLHHLMNAVIVGNNYGLEKVNLSGGELKRLSVATELLSNPSLLFCDEPTTGLDSYSAFLLVSVLKDLSEKNGKTIICSIHQPNDAIFQMFDQIILLHKGRSAFIGSRDEAISYFQNLGYNYHDGENQANYLIRSLSTNDEKANIICNNFRIDSGNFLDDVYSAKKDGSSVKMKKLLKNQIYHPSWFYQLCILIWREFLCVSRNPSIEIVRLIQHACLAFVMGLCFYHSVSNTQVGMQNLQGIIFSLITENSFPPMYCMLNYIPCKFPIFYREYVNGINTSLNFIVSNTLSVVPLFVVCPVMFTLITYWLVPLKSTFFAVFFTCLICVLVTNVAVAFGILLSVICNNETMAMVITIPFDNMFFIVSGIFVQLRSLPAFISWIQYVSWIKQGVEALFIIQMHGVRNIVIPITFGKDGLEFGLYQVIE